MKVKDIVNLLEEFAPASFQESYDNSGLQLGSPEMDVSGILLALDVIPEVVEEAVKTGCNLIVSHHPLLFAGLKRITGSNYTERAVMKAISHNIAVISWHTSADSAYRGVNERICRKIGLKNLEILSPAEGKLRKLVTFVPKDHINKVREAVFEAGAGKIGNYDSCSFHAEGAGSFRGGEDTNPFVGEKGKLHLEPELRFETIFPLHLQKKVIQALKSSHPYEEVAYDIYALENEYNHAGIGMIGELESTVDEKTFLDSLKEVFSTGVIRHSKLLGKKVQRVAVCGGSGSFLIQKAIKSGVQFLVTGDMKYHQFFDAEDKIVIADIGHYESEKFTTEIFYDLITKKFPKFAVRFSDTNTNPINYF